MEEQSLQKLSARELTELMVKTVDELLSVSDISEKSRFVKQKQDEIEMIQKVIEEKR